MKGRYPRHQGDSEGEGKDTIKTKKKKKKKKKPEKRMRMDLFGARGGGTCPKSFLRSWREGGVTNFKKK